LGDWVTHIHAIVLQQQLHCLFHVSVSVIVGLSLRLLATVPNLKVWPAVLRVLKNPALWEMQCLILRSVQVVHFLQSENFTHWELVWASTILAQLALRLRLGQIKRFLRWF
jgi:hypothetical protein